MNLKGKTEFLLIFLVCVVVLKATEGHRPPCTQEQFRCHNGKCIKRTFFCDRDDDCGDMSDERFCSINVNYESCPSFEGSTWKLCDNRMRCYPSEWKCDGKTDCPDNSDEIWCTRCTPNSCQNNGTCSESHGETMCSCKEPFTGDKCQINRCFPNPCQNNGTCSVHNGEVNCTCKSASTGNWCEFENDVHAIEGSGWAKTNLTQYFLNMRKSGNSINRWGRHLLRTAMVLYLSDPAFFATGNSTGKEMAYEMSLQLLSKLVMKKHISTWELSLFINSLMLSCIDPRNFFGVDVVAELRKRIDNSNDTNSFAILTLCNAKETMMPDDVQKVSSEFDAQFRPVWTDTQAISTIALACLSTCSNLNVDDRSLREMVSELKKKQHHNGTVENLKTTALVLQALLATGSYRDNFDFEGSVKYIMHEMISKAISTEDAYYILPVLSFKSLANISSDHCRIPVKTDLDIPMVLRDKRDDRIPVQYSVLVGDEMEFVRTWKLKVAANYSFYQVLESIGAKEPEYKVQYSIFEGKPYVSGLYKLVDNAENRMFWFTYTQALNTTDKKLIEDSPVGIKVNPNEELILWYRSGSWTATKLDRR